MPIDMLSTPALKTPPLGHPSRGIFESAVRNGDVANECLARLDSFIDYARDKNLSEEIILPQIAHYRIGVLESIEKALRQTTSRHQPIYRLMSTHDTLEEMIFVPRIFADPQSTRQDRSDATQHLAGTHAQMLERLLPEYARATHEMDKGDYAGLISEQTFLAAINMAYEDDMTAIQSLTYEDRSMLTDCFVHLRTGTESHKVPVQIKTSGHDVISSSEILYIAMTDYNPNLCLSEGIVRYMNGGELSHSAQKNLKKLTDLIQRKGPMIANKTTGMP